MPKVSIIIHVYNTKAYLRECLDSVCQQTEQDIEIIIVNDASPDSSQDIIDEYVAKDSRVVTLCHETNKGLGGARNTGIEAARGEYLMFLDSDDTLLPHTCARALSYIENSDYQIVEFCKVRTDRQNRKILQYEYADIPQDQQHYEGRKIMAAYLHGSLATAMQTRIYRRDFWQKHKLCFPEYMMFEDDYTVVDIFHACSTLLKVNEGLYRHRQHELSITNWPISGQAICDKLKALEHQKNVIFGHNEYLELRPNIQRKIKDRFLAYYYKKMPGNEIQVFIQAAVDYNLFVELFEELSLEWRSLGLYSRKRRLRNWLRPKIKGLISKKRAIRH